MPKMFNSNWKHCKTTHTQIWTCTPCRVLWLKTILRTGCWLLGWLERSQPQNKRKKKTESWIWTVRKEEKKGEENRRSDHTSSWEMFFFIFQGITNWITYRYCMDKRNAPQASRPLKVIEASHWLGVLLLHCSGSVISYRGQGQY